MGKTEKSAASIGIIGGADGPTVVFTAGRKIPLKQRIRRAWFDFKRSQVAKRIKPEGAVPGTQVFETYQV